jgi:hypothetical protein
MTWHIQARPRDGANDSVRAESLPPSCPAGILHQPRVRLAARQATPQPEDVTIMHARVDDRGVWTFTGGGEVAPVAQPSSADAGGVVRSTLTVSADRSSMTARWERSDDGSVWQPWMSMLFTRMP